MTMFINFNKLPVLKSYLEGYQRGLRWPDAWEKTKPGGPAVDDDYTRKLNEAWLIGWQAGHSLKKETGRSNAAITE